MEGTRRFAAFFGFAILFADILAAYAYFGPTDAPFHIDADPENRTDAMLAILASGAIATAMLGLGRIGRN